MAFLDNSGDIILDAVLTDLGRKRLAAGRFNVYKFALGDEEINYELWNSTDPRGTAFYDLQILQTPILEAFTSDQSLMRSRLMTFSRNDILYMPVLKVNTDTNVDHCQAYNNETRQFLLIADETTFNNNGDANGEGNLNEGIIKGHTNNITHSSTRWIAVDQGIDSTDGGQNVTTRMSTDMLETSFLIKVDNRLLTINTLGDTGAAPNTQAATYQYLDDDYIASYYFTRGNSSSSIVGPTQGDNWRARVNIGDDATADQIEEMHGFEVFRGPLGRTLRFKPTVKSEVTHSDALFHELGSTGTNLNIRGAEAAGRISSYKYIDTTITVEGMTTGYSIDIPIRIIKGTF